MIPLSIAVKILDASFLDLHIGHATVLPYQSLHGLLALRSVLIVLPQQKLHPTQQDLKALQQAVGGSIGASYPFEDPVAIVYNDDGKLMGLPLNRALWDEDGLMYDVVAGTFLVVGLGEEDFVSLSPELTQKYEEEFHQPEAFLPLGRRLMVIPVPDESVQNDAEKAVSKPPVEHDR